MSPVQCHSVNGPSSANAMTNKLSTKIMCMEDIAAGFPVFILYTDDTYIEEWKALLKIKTRQTGQINKIFSFQIDTVKNVAAVSMSALSAHHYYHSAHYYNIPSLPG